MGQALEAVWLAWDEPDDEFHRRYKQARAAAADFMEAVGRHIARRGAGR